MQNRSLERLVPESLAADDTTGAATLKLHLERYEFAARHVSPGRVLDIACGVGYGTRLLADRCRDLTETVGVDVSPEAVDYAVRHYGRDGVRFLLHDAMQFADPERFDTVVSLETFEHLPRPEAFLDNLLRRVIRPGGVLVCSAPTTPSVDANPHHLHDFSNRSFRRLFERRGLKQLASFEQIQPFVPLRLLAREEARLDDLRRNLPLYYLTHPGGLFRRIFATLRHGFQNRYLTVAWQREKGDRRAY